MIQLIIVKETYGSLIIVKYSLKTNDLWEQTYIFSDYMFAEVVKNKTFTFSI